MAEFMRSADEDSAVWTASTFGFMIADAQRTKSFCNCKSSIHDDRRASR